MAKFSIYNGDITKLKVEAIVNAGNESGLGCRHGPLHCIDGAIHEAAGPQLLLECLELNGLPTGVAKITKGHNLPCKHIIHVTGPRAKKVESDSKKDKLICDFTMLAKCYIACLEVAKENNIKEIAFCGISTGLFGFPKSKSAVVAVTTIIQWFETNNDYIFAFLMFLHHKSILFIRMC